MKYFLQGAFITFCMLVVAGVFVGGIMLFNAENDQACKEAYYQMQSVLRCAQEYPRCEVTADDYEEGRWNSDFYASECHEYEQRRPKPQPKPKAEKQSFDI